MIEKTKACNLTYDEIQSLLQHHGMQLHSNNSEINKTVERINYLNKRLSTFNEGMPEVKSEPNAAGWTSNNG